MTDETVVEADGIRVTKSFDADDFPVPAVRFDVTSTHDDETTLTITDEIPDEFDIDQIGFHPEYGSEHWTATGDGVVRFERSVEPDESFTTVYGVRMGADEEPTALLDAPTITVGDDASTMGIEDVVPPESSDIVRELAGGKRDTIPGLEDESSAESAEAGAPGTANEPLLDALHEGEGEIVDAEAVEPAVTDGDTGVETELETEADATAESEESIADIVDDEPAAPTEPTDEPDLAAEPTNEPDATEDDTPDSTLDTAAGSDAPPEDVAAVLATQIQNGDVDDDDLDVLRQELAPKRSNVQLEHLQSRVSEMEAYADALGAFIDENGDARGILEDLQEEVERMDETISGFDSSFDEAASDRAALRDAIDSVEDELDGIDAVEARIDRVAGDVDALDDRVSGVEESTEDVDELREELQGLRDEMRELKQWRDQLSDVFGGA